MISLKTKRKIDYTSDFKKQLRKIIKQGKDTKLLLKIITKLANGEKLPRKYKNHKLINDKYFEECYECHIQPDWLLVYKYINDNLVLLLVSMGSHSELFRK